MAYSSLELCSRPLPLGKARASSVFTHLLEALNGVLVTDDLDGGEGAHTVVNADHTLGIVGYQGEAVLHRVEPRRSAVGQLIFHLEVVLVAELLQRAPSVLRAVHTVYGMIGQQKPQHLLNLEWLLRISFHE